MDRLNDQVAFRVPHGVRKAIERAAKLRGQSSSEFCREIILEAVQAILVADSKVRDGLA